MRVQGGTNTHRLVVGVEVGRASLLLYDLIIGGRSWRQSAMVVVGSDRGCKHVIRIVASHIEAQDDHAQSCQY